MYLLVHPLFTNIYGLEPPSRLFEIVMAGTSTYSGKKTQPLLFTVVARKDTSAFLGWSPSLMLLGETLLETEEIYFESVR